MLPIDYALKLQSTDGELLGVTRYGAARRDAIRCLLTLLAYRRPKYSLQRVVMHAISAMQSVTGGCRRFVVAHRIHQIPVNADGHYSSVDVCHVDHE